MLHTTRGRAWASMRPACEGCPHSERQGKGPGRPACQSVARPAPHGCTIGAPPPRRPSINARRHTRCPHPRACATGCCSNRCVRACGSRCMQQHLQAYIHRFVPALPARPPALPPSLPPCCALRTSSASTRMSDGTLMVLEASYTCSPLTPSPNLEGKRSCGQWRRRRRQGGRGRGSRRELPQAHSAGETPGDGAGQNPDGAGNHGATERARVAAHTPRAPPPLQAT